MLTFSGLMLFFVALTFMIFFLAKAVSSDVNEKIAKEKAQEQAEAQASAVQPSAGIIIGSPVDSAASATNVALAEETTKSGEEVYQANCAVCHDAGIAGSPKLGDIATWSTRISKGIETLYNNAINGINAMPPKGGSKDSDDAIKLAVDYLVENSK